MSEDWESTTIGDILSLEYGKPLPKTERDPNGAYPVYGANGVKAKSNKFYYDKPTILVGRKGSAGECNLTENKFWPLDVTYFVKFDETDYDLIFLYYMLRFQDLPRLAKGVKPGINRNDVYEIEVEVPSLTEQKRIVAILDQAFGAIERAKEIANQNLANSRELFESYLNRVFNQSSNDWEPKTIGDILALTYGKPLPKADRNANGKYPVYGANGEKARSNKYYHGKATIIVGRKGSAGEINLTEDKFWPLDVTYFVTYDESKYDLRFLYHLLWLQDLPRLAKGVKPGINRNDVYVLNVNAPTLNEQKQLADSVESLQHSRNRIEAIYERKLAALDELKQSILQKAFTGQLTASTVDKCCEETIQT